MQIMINKRRLTWAAAAFFVYSLVWLFVAYPYADPRRPKPSTSVLLMDAVLILVGIGVQHWTRGKPRYERLRLWAYFGALLMTSSLIIGLIAVFVIKP
jgi:4-amino-4-deoxy-L-arabinose transferase-like glycosyltransferase